MGGIYDVTYDLFDYTQLLRLRIWTGDDLETRSICISDIGEGRNGHGRDIYSFLELHRTLRLRMKSQKAHKKIEN